MKNIRTLLCLGLLPLFSAPAMAGEWHINVVTDGQIRWPIAPYSGQWVAEDAVMEEGDFVAGGSNVYPAPGKTDSVELEGWCKAVVTWHPNGTALPRYVSFLATPAVSGAWDETVIPRGNATLVLDGVSGDATESIPAYSNRYVEMAKRKPYLIQLDTSSMTVDPLTGLLTAELPQWDVKVALTLVNDSQQQGGGSVGFHYQVQADDRLVRLSRSGAPTPRFEQDSGLTKNRDEWVEADGTGHGHTLASYYERVLTTAPFIGDTTSDDPRDVTQTVQANHSGGWSNQLSAKWTPSVSQDQNEAETTDTNNPDYQIRMMPRSNAIHNPEGIGTVGGFDAAGVMPGGWLNTGSPGDEVTFEYELTDNGGSVPGMTATAAYHLKLHDEWENETTDARYPSGESTEEFYYVPQNATPVSKDQQVTWQTSQTTSFKIALKSYFEAGFGLGDWGKAGGSVAVEREVQWDTEWSTTAKQPSAIYTDEKYNDQVRYLPIVVFTATRGHKLVDHFGVGGFVPAASTSELAGSLKGMTPQSKVDDVRGSGVPAWWPFRIGGFVPHDGAIGAYNKSGGVS